MIDSNNIKFISDDTLYLDNETAFIAKKGKNFDLKEIIEKAKLKNPQKIIVNKKINDSQILYCKNIKEFEKKFLKKYKVIPKLIGVTGTNGKTSTTTIIYSILKGINKKVMLIGSNGVYFNNLHFETRNTTPSKLSILYLINKYLDNESYLVIELSSQSYNRIKDFKFDYLIYTNLNNEHLDYHKTMNRYFQAKLKIINLLKNKKNLYVNFDDKYGKKIIKKYSNAKKYSLKDLEIVSTSPIKFIYNDQTIFSNLVADFNVYNIYSSYLLLSNIFDNKEEIIKEINSLNPIEGRNNIYRFKNNYIVIDYAHTPASFNNIINYYFNLTHNKIYVLFGFGGNKDKEKRNLMVKCVLKYTKNIIITEDNNRNEPFVDILKSSLKDEIDSLIVIQERKEAIRYAISKLESNDYLLILGKGNENYMLKKGKKENYSDFEEIKKWIN